MSTKKDVKETVKIKVLKPFWDKFDHKTHYTEGMEVEFEYERAMDVIDRGLAEHGEPVG